MRRISSVQVQSQAPSFASTQYAAESTRPAFNVYTRRNSEDASELDCAVDRAFSRRYEILKRVVDVMLSLVLLAVFLPVGFLVALLVLASSRGPVFYRETRIGRFGAPFRIFKFRSMYCTPPKSTQSGPQRMHVNHELIRMQKKTADPRITPLGRYLRKLSLDELPQLFNVLIGDMSLVGPRPIVTAERHFYGNDLAYYHLLSPGITGLWQVSGRSDVGYDKRVSLDKEYATRWSCLLDLAILARTIPAVLKMHGAY